MCLRRRRRGAAAGGVGPAARHRHRRDPDPPRRHLQLQRRRRAVHRHAAQLAWRLDYTTLGKRGGNDVTPYGAADTGKGRVAQVSRDVPTGPDGTNQTARTTIVYRVPTAVTRATVT